MLRMLLNDLKRTVRAAAADVRQAITCGDGLSAKIRCRWFSAGTRDFDRLVGESLGAGSIKKPADFTEWEL